MQTNVDGLMTTKELSKLAGQWMVDRNITKYRVNKRTGLAPATVHRFFKQQGDVRLVTAIQILNAIGLDLQLVQADDS